MTCLAIKQSPFPLPPSYMPNKQTNKQTVRLANSHSRCILKHYIICPLHFLLTYPLPLFFLTLYLSISSPSHSHTLSPSVSLSLPPCLSLSVSLSLSPSPSLSLSLSLSVSLSVSLSLSLSLCLSLSLSLSLPPSHIFITWWKSVVQKSLRLTKSSRLRRHPRAGRPVTGLRALGERG